MKYRSLFSLLLAATACALFATRLQAQSNPDFSNVNDILHGNRTLLNITDLVVSKIDLSGGEIWAAPITTSNSKPTGSGTGSWSYSGADWAKLYSFSAHMLNQPQAVILTTAHGGGTLGLVIMNGNQFIAFNPQSPSPPFADNFFQPLQAGDDPLVTSGATADFTLEGYEDLALSFNDGRLLVVAATDRNNFWNYEYYFPPLHSSIASLDVLKDMAAGDFEGDGKQEIAGLTVLPNGGLKLVVYAVDPQSLAITPASSLVLTTPGANNANPITHVSIARGKFNTRDHDQLAVAFATDSGPSTVEIVDFAANSLTPIENVTNALVASKVGISGGFIQVKTGQFAFPLAITNRTEVGD